MNTLAPSQRSAAETAFLAELLAQTLALADTIVGAIEADRHERYEETLSPIRLAEIAADADMRAGVGKAMDRELARQMLERRASAAAKRPDAPVKPDLVEKPAPVANLKPAPFALTPAVVAKLIGSPTAAQKSGTGSVDVPIAPVKLVDRPRRSEDPRLAKANDDSAPPAPSSSEPSAPSTCSGQTERSRPPVSLNGTGAQKCTPAAIDEAQHCHSSTSADEHTEAAGVPISEAVAAECADKATRRAVARKFGGGVGKPLARSDVAFDQDAHERELARIERRPPIKTSNQAERRAAERAAEEAKAARIAQLKASWAKVRQRADGELQP